MPFHLVDDQKEIDTLRPEEVARSGITVQSSTHAARAKLRVYLVLLLVPTILLFLVGLLIAPSQWLSERIQDPFLDDVGYGGMLHHKDCAIVIYGDSSAEVGIDAIALQERTGMSACNLGEPASMTTINGTTILDRYLAQNKPPRIIVFLFAPEHLTPNAPNKSLGAFEAITYRMRQPRELAHLMMMWREPQLLFDWASFADESAAHVLVRMALSHLHLRSDVPGYERHSRLQRQGSLTLPGFTSADCQSMPEPQKPDPAWISSLRKKYISRNTIVFVDAMAIPDCDPGLAWDRSHIQPLVDNGITTLPISVYFPLSRHVNAEGAKVLTDRLAEQILGTRDPALVTAQ